MTRAILALVTMLFPLLAASPAEAKPLPSKQEWKADVRAAMQGSLRYLNERVAQEAAAPSGRRLAIVLDIDNTSLATEYAWPKAVLPTRHFARHARELGIGVIFVTGRYHDTLGSVRPVLRRAGYRITTMCGRERGEAIVRGKQRCRRELTAQGWTIVANVGNRRTDLAGRNYERGFKLPNYAGKLG